MNRKRLLVALTAVCITLFGITLIVLAQSGPPPSASGTGQSKNIIITFGAAEHLGDDQTPVVTGVAQQHDTQLGTKITIDIDCLRVSGNEAFLSGPVVRSNVVGVDLGASFLFAVRDNGEGDNALGPDEFTTFTMNADCRRLPRGFPAYLPSERGNIQVRGESSISACGTCPDQTICCEAEKKCMTFRDFTQFCPRQ